MFLKPLVQNMKPLLLEHRSWTFSALRVSNCTLRKTNANLRPENRTMQTPNKGPLMGYRADRCYVATALWIRQRTRDREVIDRLLSFVDHQCQSFGLRLPEHLAENGPQLA